MAFFPQFHASRSFCLLLNVYFGSTNKTIKHNHTSTDSKILHEVSVGMTHFFRVCPVSVNLGLKKEKSEILVFQEANIFHQEMKHLDSSL